MAMLEAVRIRNPKRVYDQYPHQVSGGMGQRVMIAMMLIPEPDLIIADEPTSALDVTVRLQVLAILDDLVGERGLGLIFISHDLNLVRSFCDRVLIMYAGRIVESIAAADLDKAEHPYSRGLLESLPRIDAPRDRLPVLKRDPAWLGAMRRMPVRRVGSEACPASCRVGTTPRTLPILEARMRTEAGDRVENLSLSFGSGADAAQVLDEVSFSIEAGEVFGLVGESGSGKSTILRCLAGLYTHWTGAISLNGEPIGQKLSKARCRLMQMVFQDPYGSLHPRHTVNSVLSEPLAIHGIGDAARRIDKVLIEVGLGPHFRYRYPHQLSGGQRQRVAIARALILEPKILLLDEPTSALDVSVQAEILNLLADIREREGLTYVLVSHDLGVIAHMCHRFAVMQHGRIVETLDRADLTKGRAAEPYTQVLIEASRHYDRGLARKVAQAERASAIPQDAA